MIRPYPNYKYIIIQPSEIGRLEKPEFGTGRRGTELEYKKLIEDSQEFFQRYIENPTTDSFYIEEKKDAAYIFVDIANAITVGKNEYGQYEMDSNGRHRLYVAKKYKLPLLVCCTGEGQSCNKVSLIQRIFKSLIKVVQH